MRANVGIAIHLPAKCVMRKIKLINNFNRSDGCTQSFGDIECIHIFSLTEKLQLLLSFERIDFFFKGFDWQI